MSVFKLVSLSYTTMVIFISYKSHVAFEIKMKRSFVKTFVTFIQRDSKFYAMHVLIRPRCTHL